MVDESVATNDSVESALTLARCCHYDGIHLGELVPWKDDNYKEPKMMRMLGIDTDFKVTSISYSDALEQDLFYGLYALDRNYSAFPVFFVLDEPSESSVEATFETIKNMKLFIGNNSAFYLIRNENDNALMKGLDDFRGSAVIGEKRPSHSEYTKYFGTVPMEVFDKYINYIKFGKE